MAVAYSGSFGARLRHLREQAGLTQEALAERARLSPDAVAALERGRRTAPRLSTVALLAAALKLDPTARAELLAAARTPEEAPPAARQPVMIAPLPVPPTALVGRERELALAVGLLRRTPSPVRLLTLTGLGGVGKTRLALAVAAAVQADYPNGTAFVDLAPLRDHRLVPAAVARAVGVSEREGQSARNLLLEHLRERRLLLVLDNFEHVLAAAELAAALLAECPRLTLLVTSRAALRLRAEHRLRVPPLAAPPGDQTTLEGIAAFPAPQLFIERAHAVAPGFALTAQNGATVAELCRRLDGLPLAIELAAARIALMPPEALLTRLGRRLTLLADGPRDAPTRQQTLRAALAWSYDLLAPDEQALLRRLAVLVGDWQLDAAAAIAGQGDGIAILSGVAALLEQSLLREEAALGGEPRFRMLETVREFALERLAESGEADAIRQRHADYFLAFAEAARPHLYGTERRMSLARLGAEQENLRAALQWHAEGAGTPALGLRLAAALWLAWYHRGQVSEGRDWLERLLAAVAASPRDAVRARALNGAGTLAWVQGDFAVARARLEEALVICKELEERAVASHAHTLLGLVQISQAEPAAALASYREGLALARETGDRWLEAFTKGFLGDAMLLTGDPAAAEPSYEAAVALYRDLGDDWGCIQPLIGLGNAAAARGDHAAARVWFLQALALARQEEDKASTTHALVELGGAALAQGDLPAAAAAFTEGLALARAVGTRIGLAFALAGLAQVASRTGRPALAVRLLAAVPSPVKVAQAGVRSLDLAAFDGAVAALRAQLDPAAFAAAWAAGAALTSEQALTLAGELAPGEPTP